MAIRDPYRNFKFEVEIDGFLRAGFSKVTGLKATTTVIEYREGGENESPHKIPGQTKYDDVVLERGMSNDQDFQKWRKEVYDVTKKDGMQGDDNFRRTVVIYMKDKSGKRVKKYTLARAWPNEDALPDLDTTADDVAIESLTLAHEGYEVVTLS